MKRQKIIFLLILFLTSCSGSPTESMLTPTASNSLPPTFTPKPTIIDSPTAKPTNTPIPFEYVVLQDPFPNCSVMISSNDAFNGVFPSSSDEMKSCQGERYGHFDLSPFQCSGEKIVVAPVAGTTHIFDPGDGKHAINITLPQRTLLKGIENVFNFIGISFEPQKVNSIMIGLGHIDFKPDIGNQIAAGQELGKLTYVPQSKIKDGIFAIGVFVTYNGKEYYFSPDLFVHSPWTINPASPYDMTPTPKDYKPGCPLLSN